MRSSTDKKLGGVCAGLGAYLDLDVTLVRVLWVLAVFCGGTGLLLYVVLWIVLPVEPLYVPVSTQTQTTAIP
jgi:phage shock protein PspC (stress-responsive transcriptional regulator)